MAVGGSGRLAIASFPTGCAGVARVDRASCRRWGKLKLTRGRLRLGTKTWPRELAPKGAAKERVGATVDAMKALKPAFDKNGTVTAANASGINDGAAAVVLASAKKVKELGLKPLGKIKAFASAGVDPKYMGMGPVPASKRCLSRAGWTPKDLDLMEINEAFAAQAIAVARGLEFDMKKVNVNGGAIALGHPIGCSGAFLATKAVYELHRTAGRYALVTMCIGGGQGIAAIFERL